MSKRTVLVTAGLPYSNGRLHVGHIAGCYLPADIYVRYLRMNGHDVRYVCGSDDHGVAIMIAAEKEGKSPAEVAAYYNRLQQEDFAGLNIQFDAYGSTSQTPQHKGVSQGFFKKIFEKGFFEKRTTKQFYDSEKKVFLPDRYVKGTCGFCGTADQNGDQCENCGKLLDAESLKDARSTVSGNPAEPRDTIHWFLDLSKFQNVVEDWVSKAELREHTRNYVKSIAADGLVTRSMTRDISWGIPVPLDDPDAKGKVLYVWFDAPIGYISNTQQMCEAEGGSAQDYEKWWKSPDTEIFHFIGEDNTIFHCVIWIAMLSAEGTYSLPKGVTVNQFLNIQFPDKDVEKISKSRGTAVWIGDYLSEGNEPDILRYYLTAIAPERARTVYMPEDLIQKNNTDLANVIGNFVNRVVSFYLKHYGEELTAIDPSKADQVDAEFLNSMKRAHNAATKALEERSTKTALNAIMEFARECNKYIDDKKPWASRKTDEELTKHTLRHGMDAIKFLSIVLYPFIPAKAEKMAEIFGLDLSKVNWADGSERLSDGTKINKPEILFQKIENES